MAATTLLNSTQILILSFFFFLNLLNVQFFFFFILYTTQKWQYNSKKVKTLLLRKHNPGYKCNKQLSRWSIIYLLRGSIIWGYLCFGTIDYL